MGQPQTNFPLMGGLKIELLENNGNQMLILLFHENS